MTDHYKTLGIKESASEDEIKKAFHIRSRECHPDLHGNSPESIEQFNTLTIAYNYVKKAHKEKFAAFGIKPTKRPDDLQVAFRVMVDELKVRQKQGDDKAEEEIKLLSAKYNELISQMVGPVTAEW